MRVLIIYMNELLKHKVLMHLVTSDVHALFSHGMFFRITKNLLQGKTKTSFVRSCAFLFADGNLKMKQQRRK